MNLPGQPRQRLRPWLIDQINSSCYPGLEWTDKSQLMFKIPWKHFGRPGVDEQKDALLFRNYAIHTKKFKEGDRADVSTWKTRFRCALHKHPEIEEVHSLSQLDGDEPYRVYKFVSRPDRDASAPDVGSPEALPYHINPVLASPSSVYGELTIEDIEDHLKEVCSMAPEASSAGSYDIKLEYPPIDAGFDVPLEPLEIDISDIIGTDSYSVMPGVRDQQDTKNPKLVMLNNISNEPSSQDSLHITPIHVKLYYGDQEVGEQVIDNPQGLRIAFNPPPPLPEDVVKEETSEVVSHIFGPFQAEQIYFPHTTDEKTAVILNCIKRGLVLQARNGEIYATRLCRAKVFYSDSAMAYNEVKELKREHTTLVFDYFKEFLPSLQLYLLGQRNAPSCELYFSFGQKWSVTSPLKNNFIYVKVTHGIAQQQMKELHRQKPESILVSEPNMLDIIATQIEDLSLRSSAGGIINEGAEKKDSL